MTTSQVGLINSTFRVHHENLTHKINGCKIPILVKAVEIEIIH